MAGRIELPFLYQTRTIVGRSRRLLDLSRRLVSSHEGREDLAKNGSVSPSPEQEEPFLRAKARGGTWAPLTGKPIAKDSEPGSTISSTITASERRAFEAILRFAPKQDGPKSVTPRSPHQDAVDTDIDAILKIFTSSVRDHDSKLGAMQDDQRAAESLDPEVRTKHPMPQGSAKMTKALQSSSQPSTGISLPTEEMVQHQPISRAQARSEHEPRSAEQVHPGPYSVPAEDQPFTQATEGQTDEPPLWSPFGGKGEPGHVLFRQGSRSLLRDKPEPESNATLATSSANTDDPLAGEPSKDAVPEDSVDQYLLETAPPSQAMSQLESSIQSAVRARMLSLSAALEAAATSTTQRGDTAMWEVVESQIFSLAKHFQPRTTQHPRKESQPFGGISKFTFSREKSDKPAQLIEAAERQRAGVRMSQPSASAPGPTSQAPSGAATASEINNVATPPPAEPLSHHDLQILQHIYPAALLLALRLYITQFPSSPYAFLLLPRIRALGTTSYVLGASPQFYNSLMSLVWLVRSSLREVDGLLGEMERGGVEMDEGTYAVLGAIEEARTADLEREKRAGRDDIEGTTTRVGADADPSRGAAWWKRQEQMLFFPRVLDWLDVIAGRLAAKERAGVVEA
ncbi:hypothetical protein A1O7_04504 [Cladophialophora yegresii CBS 114405]|uniref:Mtf2-like C-terminal domain-containing protein n=1 Tax=Cladophialophora yegresii CBS 114405 TaxID=1182544 RepID=W9VX25_9EURO|nr:uncharacterized protein A1O7_04504 [Cladophialophora yegresii CBS 114405]EXJ60352.1 hypothetical protein A1O7_04504 [Cladophialophora yegresii CBS 114405]